MQDIQLSKISRGALPLELPDSVARDLRPCSGRRELCRAAGTPRSPLRSRGRARFRSPAVDESLRPSNSPTRSLAGTPRSPAPLPRASPFGSAWETSASPLHDKDSELSTRARSCCLIGAPRTLDSTVRLVRLRGFAAPARLRSRPRRELACLAVAHGAAVSEGWWRIPGSNR